MKPLASKEDRKHARRRARALRARILAGIFLAGLGVGAYLWIAAYNERAEAPLVGKVFDVAADMAGFSVKEIRVKVGEPVTIRLRSLDGLGHVDGAGRHQLAIDELKLNLIAPPLSTVHASFTPDKPGTYTYYCDVCCGGRSSVYMQGRLVVES